MLGEDHPLMAPRLRHLLGVRQAQSKKRRKEKRCPARARIVTAPIARPRFQNLMSRTFQRERGSAASFSATGSNYSSFRPSCVSIIRARWWSGKYDVTGGLIEAEYVHSPVPGGAY